MNSKICINLSLAIFNYHLISIVSSLMFTFIRTVKRGKKKMKWPFKMLILLNLILRWVVSLQNGNMNVRHYLLDVLAFLEFLNRTSRPIAHLTRHSRNRISRQLRQKLKNINTHIKSHKRALKDSGNNPSTPKRRVNKSTS